MRQRLEIWTKPYWETHKEKLADEIKKNGLIRTGVGAAKVPTYSRTRARNWLPSKTREQTRLEGDLLRSFKGIGEVFQLATQKSYQVKPKITTPEFVNQQILLSGDSEILDFLFVHPFGRMTILTVRG